ncbi:hypothetical protein ACNKHS_15445 [Shigella flexneri]
MRFASSRKSLQRAAGNHHPASLKNLTHIERQLSTRKPAGSDPPDGSKADAATTPDSDTPKQEDVSHDKP